MQRWIPNSLDLFKAKLSRYIAFWVFASIVLIETVILVPSYFRQQQELLQKLEKVSHEVLVPLLSDPAYQTLPASDLLKKLNNRRQNGSVILGYTLYSANGAVLGSVGEKPELTFQGHSGQWMGSDRTLRGDRYDVAWGPSAFKGKYAIIVRHDATSVQAELNEFLVRIGLLVLIITIFVTLATMFTLGVTVITPIVQLRNDLIAAGEAISQDLSDAQFQTCSIQRQDELGEVITAFRQMFQRVTQEIATRQAAELQLRTEQEKAERLLLNILPAEIATQLKQNLNPIACRFDEVTILFADIVQFTELSARVSPVELVGQLNQIFSAFDQLAEQCGLEKIKTIGDAYMVVGGLPTPRTDHAEAIARIALKMQDVISKFQTDAGEPFRLRIGINSGTVVAGVIGLKKFSYDLWGDAVNLASRMESHGLIGKIQVAEATYQRLKPNFIFEERGVITVKGRGEMPTYWLVGERSLADSHRQTSPPQTSV